MNSTLTNTVLFRDQLHNDNGLDIFLKENQIHTG